MQVNQSFVISLGLCWCEGPWGATFSLPWRWTLAIPLLLSNHRSWLLLPGHLHARSAYFYYLCDCTKVYFSLPGAASSSAALNTGGSGCAAVQSAILITVKEIPSLQKISKGLLKEYHPDGGCTWVSHLTLTLTPTQLGRNHLQFPLAAQAVTVVSALCALHLNVADVYI